MEINLSENSILIIQHALGYYIREAEKQIKKIEAQNLPEDIDLIRLTENLEEAENLSQNLSRSFAPITPDEIDRADKFN